MFTNDEILKLYLVLSQHKFETKLQEAELKQALAQLTRGKQVPSCSCPKHNWLDELIASVTAQSEELGINVNAQMGDDFGGVSPELEAELKKMAEDQQKMMDEMKLSASFANVNEDDKKGWN
jgi:hypothetical protein